MKTKFTKLILLRIRKVTPHFPINPFTHILLVFLTFTFFLLTLPGCLTEPPIDNIPPGRRDYVWTVDTLKAPVGELFYLWSIWGSDTNNVWIAGRGSAPYNLWHFDGNKWKPYPNQAGSLISIYGFDKNNIWAAGGGCVSHFVNSEWNIYKCFDLPNNPSNSSDIALADIWGNTSNNIFAVGGGISSPPGLVDIGQIFHFNGKEWKRISIPELNIVFTNIGKDRYDGKYYLSGTRLGTTVADTQKIFIYDGNKLKQISSGIEVATANEMNGEIYLAIGKKIYKYQNNSLKVWKDFSSTTYLGRVWGRSEKDFFGEASDGLAHYNGTDLKTIYPTNLFIDDVFVMERDIFMLCENIIIIHGKLKNE